MRLMFLILFWDITIGFNGVKPEIDVHCDGELAGLGFGVDWS